MKNKNVAIFVDGNENIGMGHLYRMNELALEFLKHDVNIVFFTPSNLAFNFLNKSFHYNVSQTKLYEDEKYSEQVIELMKSNDISVVVLDLLEAKLKLHIFLSNLNLYITSVQSFLYNFKRFEDLIFYPDSEELKYKSLENDNGKKHQFILDQSI